MTWWVAPLFNALDASLQKKPPSYQRTEAEQGVLDQLKAKAEGGFNVQERVQQTIRPALDIRDQAKSQALGTAYQRGMQNSIITDEMMRKVDRDTQEKVLNMSDKIAQENQAYKDRYEGQVQQFIMGEEGKKRQATEAQRQFTNQRTSAYAKAGMDLVKGGMMNKINPWDAKSTKITPATWSFDDQPSNPSDLLTWAIIGSAKPDNTPEQDSYLEDLLEVLKNQGVK